MNENSTARAPRPICFMVMPFSTKRTGITDGSAPSEVDFDQLWRKALEPAIAELGYTPVRADQDVGSLIVHEMLERLTLADLVIADISIPNANVYYEIGVRHGAISAGCVLIAAEWARPVFDVAQMRRITFPLGSKEVSEAEAAEIRRTLVAAIPDMAASKSPPFMLPGFPDLDPARASSFKDLANELSTFHSDVWSVREAPRDQQAQRARDLLERYVPADAEVGRPMLTSVALELVSLVKDVLGWQDVIDLIRRYPENLREIPAIQEQYQLARSETGDLTEAVGALKELIESHGPTPERCGLLGGRYKRLYLQSEHPADRMKYLDQAIELYEQGMYLDLNDYYCSSNLPRLLRDRGEPDDLDRARAVSQLTVAACERARRLGLDDEWLEPTLLGAAFDAADPARAREFARLVIREGISPWKIKSMVKGLDASLDDVQDDTVRAQLKETLDDLDSLL